MEVADTESEATYHELFRSLKRRGLSGVELVVSDDHEGLKAAVARHFQGASWQRCQVHFARNLLGMVGHARRKELSEGLRGVFAATSREVGSAARFGAGSPLARQSHPRVAEHIEEHLEECLSCLAFPESHQRRIRTTNGLERLNQEIKRRTRVVRIFPEPRGVLEAGDVPWPSSNRRSGLRAGVTWTCGSSKSSGGKKNERLRGRCSWSGRGKDEAWRKLQKIQDLTTSWVRLGRSDGIMFTSSSERRGSERG